MGQTGNRILDMLPTREAAAVVACLSKVRLAAGQVVFRRGRRYPAIYFPVDCTISLILFMEDGDELEVGSIGREGLHGSRGALPPHRALFDSICTIGGDAYQISAEDFYALAQRLTRLHGEALRFNAAMLSMLSKLSICNRFHSPLERCSRWLLFADDRTGGAPFKVTHAFLAQLLGVHRPAVSLATGALQREGAISYSRGQMTVLNRRRLERAACECYRWVVAELLR